jgi:hypothetical protein
MNHRRVSTFVIHGVDIGSAGLCELWRLAFVLVKSAITVTHSIRGHSLRYGMAGFSGVSARNRAVWPPLCQVRPLYLDVPVRSDTIGRPPFRRRGGRETRKPH